MASNRLLWTALDGAMIHSFVATQTGCVRRLGARQLENLVQRCSIVSLSTFGKQGASTSAVMSRILTPEERIFFTIEVSCGMQRHTNSLATV